MRSLSWPIPRVRTQRAQRRGAATGLASFLVRHALLGAGIGWGLLGAILALDVGRLGSLMAASEHAPLALALLAAQFGAGFATLVTATALFLLPHDPDPPLRR
jgi:hypothetical protein